MSLRNRLLVMPVIMVGIVCIAVLFLFNIVMTEFVDNQVEQSIKSFKEYNIAMDKLEESLNSIDKKADKNDKAIQTIKSEMTITEDDFANSKNTVTTQMTVLDDEKYISQFASDIEKKLIDYYWNHEDEITSDVICEVKIGSDVYCVSTARFVVGDDTEKSDVLVYTNISTLDGFIKSVNKMLLMVLALSAVISIIIGLIMTRGITSSMISLREFITRLRNGEERPDKEDIKYKEFLELANHVEQLSNELYDAQKLQKLIFQNASHELRTPLMSIQGYAEGISTNVLKNHQSAAEIIVTESKKMSELVDEMLYISRMDENPITEADMAPIELRQIIEYCREEVCVIGEKKGVVIIESFDGGKYFLKGDEKAVTKAFSNILSNGIRYAEEKLAIAGSVEDGTIKITVSDDGKGINENDIPHVFERFYKGEGGNFGIGLSITKDIIERHGGTITAENTEKGARFTVVLPAISYEENEEEIETAQAVNLTDEETLKAVIESIPEEDRLI